jgi:hypothetical protein
MSSPTTVPAARPTSKAVPVDFFDADHPEDLLRIDLRDVPYISPGLHVEALQPSWFSRFMGLFLR